MVCGICHKVHPKAHVEVPAGTIREFVTDYLYENGHEILIIGKASVNDSVHFLRLSDQAWVSGFPFIANLLAHVEFTGWGSSNNSNENWGEQFNYANSITNAAWGASVNACTAYLLQIPVNPHAA